MPLQHTSSSKWNCICWEWCFLAIYSIDFVLNIRDFAGQFQQYMDIYKHQFIQLQAAVSCKDFLHILEKFTLCCLMKNLAWTFILFGSSWQRKNKCGCILLLLQLPYKAVSPNWDASFVLLICFLLSMEKTKLHFCFHELLEANEVLDASCKFYLQDAEEGLLKNKALKKELSEANATIRHLKDVLQNIYKDAHNNEYASGFGNRPGQLHPPIRVSAASPSPVNRVEVTGTNFITLGGELLMSKLNLFCAANERHVHSMLMFAMNCTAEIFDRSDFMGLGVAINSSIFGGRIILQAGRAYFVTAAHVIKFCHDLKIRLYDRSWFAPKVEHCDLKMDVAVISIECNHRHQLDYTEECYLNSVVFGVGHYGNPDNNQSKKSSCGLLCSIDDYGSITATIELDHGDSGGCLMNYRGQCIAIAEGRIRGRQHHKQFISIARIVSSLSFPFGENCRPTFATVDTDSVSLLTSCGDTRLRVFD